MAEKARKEGERESGVVLLREFLRGNWLRESNPSVEERHREEEEQRMRGKVRYFIIERERGLNKIMPKNYSTFFRTVLFVELHCGTVLFFWHLAHLMKQGF